MKIAFAVRSETNHLRSNNEDNLFCAGITLATETTEEPFVFDGEAETPCLVAVFDGMGGMAHGELASCTAAQVLGDCAADIMSADNDKTSAAAVQQYVGKANKLLCDAMREKASRFGTTLAIAVITDSVIRSYNLGDSRIYVLSKQGLCQVSVDHTLAAQKVRLGVLTPEQALTDSGRNKLSLYLGVFEDEFSVMAEELPIQPLDTIHRLLLCTDGLTEAVSDKDIETIMGSTKSVTEAARQLVERALGNGSKDNITCIVVENKA